MRLLRDKEMDWRMKSRATWLELGDHNIRYFHKFGSHRKSVNTIWKMRNDWGNMVRSFHGLANLGVKHFEQVYKWSKAPNIVEIIKSDLLLS
jgi:hypothetical protein